MKKRKAPSKKNKQEQVAVEALRKHQRRLLDHEGVTSVGVGYRIKDGKRTDEIVIQCSVEEKLAPEELSRQRIPALPTQIEAADGSMIGVDVVERNFRPSFVVQDEPADQAEASFHDQRRAHCDPMRPGISVSNVRGTAGTIAAFVYDRTTGEPLILSNWHVLHGPTGILGDPIVQPGPFDDPQIDGNGCGTLLRSHLGMAGDCAIARIDGRRFQPEVLELERAPKRLADPELDDLVVKSGRTTGVTFGIVSRVDVVVKINYGGSIGVQEIGGFEIRPNPAKAPENGEISLGGDSGSLWLTDSAAASADSDVAIGLHFAGETDPSPDAEHAIACKLSSVFDKLNVSLQPSPEHVVSEEDLLQEIMQRIAVLESNLARQGGQQPCRCTANATQAPGEATAAGAEASLPIYGNWCGPGHGGGPTVDAVDAACKQHDECYDRRGYFDCDCNRTLLNQIDGLLGSRRINGRARTAAAAIRAYFSVSPCVRHTNIGGRSIPLPDLPLPPLPTPRVPNVGRSIRRTFGF